MNKWDNFIKNLSFTLSELFRRSLHLVFMVKCLILYNENQNWAFSLLWYTLHGMYDLIMQWLLKKNDSFIMQTQMFRTLRELFEFHVEKLMGAIFI